ncbi:lecithin retinol acyltransferase family protein [Rubripirellula lacrimiformis]|uniref:lecithin retinol acyltransferase family protein n=1 Tax=Rubripirellula lacrimiformis TaxID=1930273 RepID=UPI001C54E123|nr:lecithin retinol acyltransferase family protein [Rubripirellula lacrimiformis]
MARGDHFFVWRRQYGVGRFQHHGIDLGDGTAVHFTDGGDGVAGPTGPSENFVIQRTTVEVVTRGGQDMMHVVAHRQRLDVEMTVDRAISQVGTGNYHLVFHNCEHFAAWCIHDRYESRQINVAFDRATAVGVKTLASTSARAVSRLGTKGIVRGVSPWMLIADAAQWATEAGGHHIGLRDPQRRKQASRAVGVTTAMSIGALGGPVGVAVAGGLWCVGEVAGEMSQAAYERARLRRTRRAADDDPVG